MGSTSVPALAVLAPGEMGAAIAARLSACGVSTILTNLDGRSEMTLERARASNMQHASYTEIVQRATCIYSVVPPKDAFALAETILAAYKTAESQHPLIFVDCNALNPESMKRMAVLFDGSGITLIDAVIIGTPPSATFNPGIYASADPKNVSTLDSFTRMSIQFGLNVIPLKGEGAGIGDASAVKMSHSGIVKGAIGLFTTMILAANAASPSTASGLLHALNHSQPAMVDLILRLLPHALPKAYRFVGEMEEVGGFAGGSGANTFEGIASIFSLVADSQSEGGVVAGVLLEFVKQAKEMREKESTSAVDKIQKS
ncbi:hypothetical protein C8F04DRAFT_1124309 [Mycena alexandri]|uniref:6-phosphogluconate dehydrogenase NADP-binding domain-containing protein n=1 Tax=Mycena alexandri TaxID=1745969 RepID=A0AAD6SGN5_9AGAR|nr:hypothetical protein C8F04DRAFT_1124309 [Mycena alexandri]